MTGRHARIPLAAALLAGTAVLTATPAASAAPVPKSAPSAPLYGTQWRFVSSGVARMAPVPYKGSHAYFSLKPNGTMGGNDGCNGIGGDAKRNGQTVTFGPLISTMMACIRPDAGAEFGKAFDGRRTVRVIRNVLQVSDGPRGYWNFVAEEAAAR